VIFSTHDIELAIELVSIYVIGYPTVGGKANHGSIVAKYDLREMGICWKESDDHDKLYKEIALQNDELQLFNKSCKSLIFQGFKINKTWVLQQLSFTTIRVKHFSILAICKVLNADDVYSKDK
jgi:hypothetical protein